MVLNAHHTLHPPQLRKDHRQAGGRQSDPDPAGLVPLVQHGGSPRALRRDQPDHRLHRQELRAPLPRLRVRRAQVRRGGVPPARHDLLGAAADQHPPAHQDRRERRRDQGGRGLHGRLRHDDRPRAPSSSTAPSAWSSPSWSARPGVYFTAAEDRTTGRLLYSAKLIPNRGAWLEIETSSKDVLTVKIDRKRKVPVTTLVRALGYASNDDIKSLLRRVDIDPEHQYIEATLDKDPTTTVEEALIELYRKIRPGDPPTVENARNLLNSLFFNAPPLRPLKVGRFKLDKNLGIPEDEARERALDNDRRVLDNQDFVSIIRKLIELNNGTGEADDIDHLGNRRVRAVGELLQNQFRMGLIRMERIIKERMTICDAATVTVGQPDQRPPRGGRDQGVLRLQPALAVHGPDQPAGRADPQAAPLGARPGRPLAGARRLRRPRRPPQPLRPDLPDRDPRGPEHRPDRLAGHLRAGQRVRLHRDPLPPRLPRGSRPATPSVLEGRTAARGLRRGRRQGGPGAHRRAPSRSWSRRASARSASALGQRRHRLPLRRRGGQVHRRPGQRAPRRRTATSPWRTSPAAAGTRSRTSPSPRSTTWTSRRSRPCRWPPR